MNNNRFQLVCPKCGHEFQFNLGQLENEIENAKVRLKSVQMRREKIRGDKTLSREWCYLGYEIQRCMAKISQLKAKRKLVKEHLHKEEYGCFKQAVREVCGEDKYQQCVNVMKTLVQAYDVNKAQQGRYIHSGKNGAIRNE
jgi:hypothetical protein